MANKEIAEDTVTEIRLIAVSTETTRRNWLEAAFANHASITVLGCGADFNQTYLSTPAASSATLIVVDLAHPEAAEARFWTAIHIVCPAVTLMAIAEPTVSEAALQAALHAGVHCFAQWVDSPERLLEAARTAGEGRRFYSTPWLIVAAQRLIRDLETGLLHTRMVRRSRRRGHPAHTALSALEADVLAYFSRHENRIISPEELIEQVWKHEVLTGDIANQVRCCVKRLRRKLDAEPNSRTQIENVRGRGYRLTLSRPR
ncbi:MAG TPA: helix-turn-helix domain-containing protein [Anaerolineales bacterium]|nr:helix-turn-helix domain-containing protein [Anaerolineales bacterium]